jgi:hypothetical protein
VTSVLPAVPRCANGHAVDPVAKFCGMCGAPVPLGARARPEASKVGPGRSGESAVAARPGAPLVSWTAMVSTLSGVLVGISLALPWLTVREGYARISLSLWQVGRLTQFLEELGGSSSVSQFYVVAGLATVAAILMVILPLVLVRRPRSAGIASVSLAAAGLLIVGGYFAYLAERVHATPDGAGFVLAVIGFLMALVAGVMGMRDARAGRRGRRGAAAGGSPWR